MIDKHISSLQHPLVKHLVKLRQDRHYRYEQQTVIIEGIKPILEISQKGIKRVFYESKALRLPIKGQEEYTVTEAVMQKISGMVSSEGVLAEVEMPKPSSLDKSHFVVAFDGINDPGNLGTLLRTALALGWQGAYLLPTSCDPFNEKALRAARGAQFKLPLAFGDAQELQKKSQKQRWTPFVADLEGRAPEACKTPSGCLLVLGNEAHGASLEVLSFCSKVTVPMPGEMESLNVAVAGGILMYLLRP